MGFGKNITLLVFLGGLITFASCVDHAGENEAEQEQIRLDSIAQADTDNAAIDAYIADAGNGIDASQVETGEYAVRRIVWNPAVSTRVPEFNEIVSVHYTGKYLDNEIFDTSNPTVARRSDSLDYVVDGVVFDDLLAGTTKTYEQVLDSLNDSDGAIDDPLYNPNRLYLPIVFNHLENGGGISFNYIRGFRSGLKEAMLEMELDARSVIMIPSAAAYGITGTINSDGTEGIPANSTLVFEFQLVNIHP